MSESHEITRNLETATADAELFDGWNNMLFDDDSLSQSSPDNNNDEDDFSPQGMTEFSIDVSDTISLRMVQASYAFHGSGQDATGCVLWGAALCLAKFLVANYAQDIKNKRVLELGCGGGLPSLVSKRLGAATVIASDSESTTLSHVAHHASLNQCDISVQRIDWEDLKCPSCVPPTKMDYILASDVIYGVSKVPAFVNTIQHCLAPKNGVVVVATRDGRRGISEFICAMQQTRPPISLVRKAAYFHAKEDAPACFCAIESLSRWTGDHTIYVFQRKENVT